MTLIQTKSLTSQQLLEISGLIDACRCHDRIRLSYPAEDFCTDISSVQEAADETASGCGCHWLLYDDDGILACALALMIEDDNLAECAAFTHPDRRRRGYFNRLLECALPYCEDRDILFTVDQSCADTVGVLQALDASWDSDEHQMERILNADAPLPSSLVHRDVTLSCAEAESSRDASAPDPAASVWNLCLKERSCSLPDVLGQCSTFAVSPDCVCLHHVLIDPRCRRQGYGMDLITLVLSRLAPAGIHKVILQVSGSNDAALSLYKKTGFRITETLSSYYY